MTPFRWVIVGGMVALFVFAKAWIIKHPTGTAAVIVGAFLLIVSEPSQAQ